MLHYSYGLALNNINKPSESHCTLIDSLWKIRRVFKCFFTIQEDAYSSRQPKSLRIIIEASEIWLGMVKTAKRKVKFWRLNVELQIGVKCKREGSNYVVASAFKANSQAHTSIGGN